MEDAFKQDRLLSKIVDPDFRRRHMTELTRLLNNDKRLLNNDCTEIKQKYLRRIFEKSGSIYAKGEQLNLIVTEKMNRLGAEALESNKISVHRVGCIYLAIKKEELESLVKIELERVTEPKRISEGDITILIDVLMKIGINEDISIKQEYLHSFFEKFHIKSNEFFTKMNQKGIMVDREETICVYKLGQIFVELRMVRNEDANIVKKMYKKIKETVKPKKDSKVSADVPNRNQTQNSTRITEEPVNSTGNVRPPPYQSRDYSDQFTSPDADNLKRTEFVRERVRKTEEETFTEKETFTKHKSMWVKVMEELKTKVVAVIPFVSKAAGV